MAESLTLKIAGERILAQVRKLDMAYVGLQGPSGPSVPAGSANRVLYSSGSAAVGDSRLTFDPATGVLTFADAVGTSLTVPKFKSSNAQASLPSWEFENLSNTGPRLKLTGSDRSIVICPGMNGNTLGVLGPLEVTSDSSRLSLQNGNGTVTYGILTNDGVAVANTLAMRNGTAGQTFRMYNTYTDVNNYERLALSWVSNFAHLVTQQLGTGAARGLILGTEGAAPVWIRTGGNNRWSVDTNGHWVTNTDNTVDVGASASGRPRWVYAGTGISVPRTGKLYIDGASGSHTIGWQNSFDGVTADGPVILGWQGGVLGHTQSGIEKRSLNWNQFGVGVVGSLSIDADVILRREGNGTMSLRNGIANQQFWLYNTYTDSLNYERLALGYNGNTVMLQATHAGTGVARHLNITTSGNLGLGQGGTSVQWQLAGGGHLWAATDNSYDIGSAAGNRPRNLYVAGAATIPSVIASTISVGSDPTNAAGVATFNGTVLICSSSDGILTLKQGGLPGTAGVKDPGWNYIQFQDSEGDRQGYFGINSTGEFEFAPEVPGANSVRLLGNVRPGGSLLFTADNTYDIGISASGRPRNVYVGNTISAPAIKNTGTTLWIENAAAVLNFGTGNTEQIYRQGNELRMWVNGADRFSVSGTQAILTVPLVTNGSVKFPAAQVASADVNTLDDYEEGTFTPTVAFGGAAVGVTYAQQTGWYTKVGNRVDFGLKVTLTAKGSSVGNMTVEGLPFASNASAPQIAVCVYINALTAVSGGLVGFNPSGTTSISLRYTGTGTVSSVTDANATNLTDILISGTYYV